MTENQTPSPLEELKNLLEDLQAKKPAGDLRLPSEATRRGLLQLDFVPREPDAATMERHLRAIYREELADLFQSACRQLYFSNDVLKRDIYKGASSGKLPLTHHQWQSKASTVLGSIPEGAIEEAPLHTIRLLMGGHDHSLGEVARIGKSLRRLPSFDVYEGLSFIAAGDDKRAHRILTQVFETTPFDAIRWNAATNLGEAAVLRGDDVDAAKWYRINACSPEPWGMSSTLWLFYAIQIGSAAECQDAAGVLRSSPPTRDLIADFVRRTRAMRLGGEWQPNSEASNVIGTSALRGCGEVEYVQELFV